MKRLNNLYEKIYSIPNLELADRNARKKKKRQYGVRLHDRNRAENILSLHEMLKNKTYKTSPYTTFTVIDKKERLVFKLPYFPDRITHHAIMNIMEPIFVSTFTTDTYSCIKEKGIHDASDSLKYALQDIPNTQYCLKIDVKKFYPTINHDVLKGLLLKKLKDRDLLWLLNGIIDSAEGLPIGNYLSQYFANFYLAYFDHWIKEEKRIKNYFRYLDDMVFLSPDKQSLHKLLAELRLYFDQHLKIHIKENYQIFPVAARGIDFVGYVHYHGYTYLRKSIKKDFARMLSINPNPASTASYYGWAIHCDSKHLLKKLLPESTFASTNNYKYLNQNLCTPTQTTSAK